MGDSGIPQPDVSGLPIEAPQSELNLQNASQAMTPQAQPPLQGTKTGIKDLLSGFMGGMGRAMMVHAGLPTPEMEQEKQQQMQIQQQNAQSLQGLRDAQTQAYQYTPYQMPDGQTVDVAKKDIPTLLKSQIAAQSRSNTSKITPEMSAAIPELKGLEGQDVPKPILDLITRKTTAGIQAAGRTQRPSAAARDDRYIQLSGVNPKTWTPDDQQFMKGYSKFVDFTKIQPGVQRAQIFAAPRWAALDPDLQARQSLAKGMATGPLANQLSSFNAFVGHLGDFHDAAQELKNTDIKLFNTGLNRVALETGDPKIQGIIAKIEPVRKEFESLLLNNRALYEADRQSADVILNPASSPAQLEIAIKSLAGTAAIRLGAVNQNVKRISGADIPELLEPANGAILEELGAQIPGYTGNGADFSQVFKAPQSPNTRAKSTTGGGTAGGFTNFTENGKQYRIPNNLVSGFKKAHPNAR